MDGGSTDCTASVVKDYASRVTFISEKDNGQSHAINKGFRLGKGSILGWINSDDVYLAGAISTVVRSFSSDANCGMVYGDGYMIDHHGKVQGRYPHSRPFDLWRLVYLSDYILQQSSYFSRRALEEVGYLDEDLKFGMDWDIFIRIGCRYPVTYIDEYLGCIRVYPETKTLQAVPCVPGSCTACFRNTPGCVCRPVRLFTEARPIGDCGNRGLRRLARDPYECFRGACSAAWTLAPSRSLSGRFIIRKGCTRMVGRLTGYGLCCRADEARLR